MTVKFIKLRLNFIILVCGLNVRGKYKRSCLCLKSKLCTEGSPHTHTHTLGNIKHLSSVLDNFNNLNEPFKFKHSRSTGLN